MLKPNFKIYQDSFAALGTPEQIANAWKGYDVVCLTHGQTVSDENGCLDVRYPQMTELIAKLREKNPDQLIFGYAPATADAPVGSGCGYTIPYAVQPWEAPGGIATKFIGWCDRWVAEKVDGIFIDLFASHFISPATRNNVASWVKHLGLLTMVNVTWPTAANVRWALECPYLRLGDYVLMEGFLSADDQDTEADSIHAAMAMEERPELRAALLVTTKAHRPVTDAQRRNLLHRVDELVRQGDALALENASLSLL